MRILSVIRLSQLSDVTTSPERQREHVDKWARVHGGEIVGQPEDLGVSGGLSPFERPKLGLWLTDTPPKPWDVLVAWRLDRVGRNALDVLMLLRWLEERGKRLVTVADGLDSAGPYAKAFIALAAVFAEMARTAAIEMSADARAKLTAEGKWLGGTVPVGYRVGGDGRLEIDPVTAPTVRRAFELATAGKSVPAIAQELEWQQQRVLRVIRNPTYVGLGSPPAPAIVDPETFEEARRPRATRLRSESSELSGVLFCLVCGRQLRVQRHREDRGRQPRHYFRCGTPGHTRGIKLDVAAELAVFTFEEEFGSEYVYEEVTHPDPVAAEATLCRIELSTLGGKLADGDRDKILARMTELSARLTELESQPPGDRVEMVNTGRTWAEEIDRLTLAELGDELRRRGVRIGLRQTSSRPPEIEVRVLFQVTDGT